MKLILENIGMLKKAEITLSKLVVISGENDNGKSTVGKVIFCIVKAINRYKEDFQESEDYKIKEKLEELFFLLRRSAPNFNKEAELSYVNLKDIIFKDPFYGEHDTYQKAVDKLISITEVKPELSQQIEKILVEIKVIRLAPDTEKMSVENALRKVFTSEFDSNLLFLGAKKGSIKLVENNIQLLDIEVGENNEISLAGEIKPVELKDATFIESPLILNNHDLLIRSQSGLEIKKSSVRAAGIPYTTLHTKDLFDKLQEPSLKGLLDNNTDDDFQSTLDRIVSGKIQYDSQIRDFVYEREDNQISIKNTASGVKVFGILQLLLSNNFLNKNTILIFDEPENHLHPNWQLHLAKILVDLSKEGLYIIVSSHSPYMIEALKRFSDSVKLNDEAQFYLAKDNAIQDKNKLEEIFNVLSEPFRIFRDMDKKELGCE